MKISFFGAAGEVTGSCHLLEIAGLRILLDCGMFQGGSDRHERNRAPFAFSASELDCVLLSHAHIDHSGRLPRLIKAGFRGPIYSSPATRHLSTILLPDAGRIQEEDARWKIRRLEEKGKDAGWVDALFTESDAFKALESFETVAFEEWVRLSENVRMRFVEAGHILGAAIVEIEGKEDGSTRRVTFSGDLGVRDGRLLGPPKKVECPDWLIIESTYGNRVREQADATEQLFATIKEAVSKGGRVVIPAFAVGRTQEILARLNDLVESGRINNLPVYVDSPMAVAATRAAAFYPENYSTAVKANLDRGDAPLDFRGLHLVTSVEDSKKLNEIRVPCVIISASGMCEAGRVKHHLKYMISDPRSTVLFTGYQAQGSLGRIIQSGGDPVRIFGEYYPVRARIKSIEAMSAHADMTGLLGWFEGLKGIPKRTFVVHGEEESAETFAGILRRRYQARADVPRLGDSHVWDE